MRRGVRFRRWLAFGAASVALLAGAMTARAQTAPSNVAQVFRSEGSAHSEKSLASKDASYITDAGADAGAESATSSQALSPGATDAPGSTNRRPGGPTCCAPTEAGAASVSSLPDAPDPQTQNNAYEPITAKERLQWLAVKTLGIDDLAEGVIFSGYGTAVNKPPEDGPHWGGFAERYGVRLTGIATSNTMEAGLGAMWGEDPRYKSARGKNFSARVASVVEQTFVTRRRDGHFAPAYARFMAVPGSNFLANAWRPDSEADSYHAGIRTLEGFGGVLGGNTWAEFWPSVEAHLFHKH